MLEHVARRSVAREVSDSIVAEGLVVRSTLEAKAATLAAWEKI